MQTGQRSDEIESLDHSTLPVRSVEFQRTRHAEPVAVHPHGIRGKVQRSQPQPVANPTRIAIHFEDIDGAGWHQTGGRLRVPDNITLLHLPPYAPELNPVENIWAFLRSNQLSNRVYPTYDAILEACCSAWNWLTSQPHRITAIASRPWAQVNQ